MAKANKESDLSRLSQLPPQKRFGERGGYTMVPHSFFTILARKCSGWAQHFAIGYIMDRTFGAAGTPEWTKLSLPVLARLTGLTTSAFHLALADAVERGLIQRKDAGAKGYAYKTTPETWIDAKEWDRKAKPEPDAVEPDAAEPDAAEPDAAEPDAVASVPAASVAVESGKSAKPIVLSVGVKGMAEPVEMRFQPRNEAGFPLIFATSVSAGTVHFTVTRGEEKANFREVHFTNSNTPTDKNHRFSELRGVLKPLLAEIGGKPLDEPFLQRIAATLGETPVDRYSSFAIDEIAAMRKARKPLRSGILDFLARQCSAAWREEGVERRAIASLQTLRIQRLRALGCTEEAARIQLDLWARHGVDVDVEIARNERRERAAGSGD